MTTIDGSSKLTVLARVSAWLASCLQLPNFRILLFRRPISFPLFHSGNKTFEFHFWGAHNETRCSLAITCDVCVRDLSEEINFICHWPFELCVGGWMISSEKETKDHLNWPIHTKYSPKTNPHCWETSSGSNGRLERRGRRCYGHSGAFSGVAFSLLDSSNSLKNVFPSEMR